MKTNKLIKVCGSITKIESLIPIKSNILENTSVVEANLPYAHYYGQVPEKPKPNSLFLFTTRFYSLEEVLRFSQNIDLCYSKNINVASAVLEFQNSQYPAIRIKNFPDYEQLRFLQECFIKQGVEFAKKVPQVNEAVVRTNKCFVLEEIEKGIYLDRKEENKGYITFQKRIKQEEFEELMLKIRNNSNCKHFDAVQGGIIVDSYATDLIRIFSIKLNLVLLKCIKNKLDLLI